MQTELMTLTDDGNQLFDFSSSRRPYSSLVAKTQEQKIAFYNAVNNPQKRLKDMINMPINIVHIYAEEITFIDKQTGEGTPGVRTVLIDDKGVSYQASSKGVFSCVAKLLQVFGQPANWEKPITIVPKQISKSSDSNVLIFEIKQ